MKYKYENIEEFTEFKSWTDKRKIDTLLEIDCSLYAHLGTDSTKAEKEEVKRMPTSEVQRRATTNTRSSPSDYTAPVISDIRA